MGILELAISFEFILRCALKSNRCFIDFVTTYQTTHGHVWHSPAFLSSNCSRSQLTIALVENVHTRSHAWPNVVACSIVVQILICIPFRARASSIAESGWASCGASVHTRHSIYVLKSSTVRCRSFGPMLCDVFLCFTREYFRINMNLSNSTRNVCEKIARPPNVCAERSKRLLAPVFFLPLCRIAFQFPSPDLLNVRLCRKVRGNRFEVCRQ